MTDALDWETLRRTCEELEPGTAIVTPVSQRPFIIEATHEDRIVTRFRDSDERRPLWREQFRVLADGLSERSIEVPTLPAGVEPYASVLTLADEFALDDDTIVRDPDAADGAESPYLRTPPEARTPPERVRDDATLLADVLSSVDASAPSGLDTETLADVYVLASDVHQGADRLRRSVGEVVVDRLGPDQRLDGRFGSVRRTTRRQRRLKDDRTVLAALDEHDIPHEWVLGVDRGKLDVVLAVTDLEESIVYDEETSTYAQKVGVDEGEKYERLRGLTRRIGDLEASDRESFRRDVERLESRLEELLSGP